MVTLELIDHTTALAVDREWRQADNSCNNQVNVTVLLVVIFLREAEVNTQRRCVAVFLTVILTNKHTG